MRNLDFLTTLNLTTQLYKSLCAPLAKIAMVILQLKKTLSILYQRDAAKEFQSYHHRKEKSHKQSQKAALPTVQFSICSSVHSCP